MKGNGKESTTNGAHPPPEAVTFTIGGEEIRVPVMMFQDLDECKDLLQGMTPDLNWITYAGKVMEVVAHQCVAYAHEDLDTVDREGLARELYAKFRKTCRADEAELLAGRMNDLLRRSGFRIPEVATLPVENLGTGTSTLSSSASPLAVSLEETPSP